MYRVYNNSILHFELTIPEKTTNATVT